MKKVSAAILGASGYSGGELIKLLEKHPYVGLNGLYAQTSAGLPVSEVHAWYGDDKLQFEKWTGEIPDVELLFLALPHGEAMQIVPELIAAGKKVVDLSGDHRLTDAETYAKYYGREHTGTGFARQAVYGLPEWNGEKIRTTSLVANPGCYATSAILPLAPLLKNKLVEGQSIIVNSLSGVSGAGRTASIPLSFSEVNESVKAYKVGEHQHTPEIESVLGELSGSDVSVTFIPHLIPITRGIYSTMVADTTANISSEEVLEAYTEYYAGCPFIRVHAQRIPEIKRVVNTNFIDIGFRIKPETNQLIVMAAIDNLRKGAAGQAVQNMNLMYGFAETEGLL